MEATVGDKKRKKKNTEEMIMGINNVWGTKSRSNGREKITGDFILWYHDFCPLHIVKSGNHFENGHFKCLSFSGIYVNISHSYRDTVLLCFILFENISPLWRHCWWRAANLDLWSAGHWAEMVLYHVSTYYMCETRSPF